MSKYLLEIGTEELPYRFIPSAITQLQTGFENFLNSNKIDYKEVKVYATPRRLAIIIDSLANKSPNEEKIIKGPIKKVAYDENNNITKAGLGFLNKNGLSEKDLYIENDYVYAKLIVKGQEITTLLQQNVPLIVMKLQGSHFMRWSNNDEKFSRPIRWIVSLLDNNEVKIKIIDKESGKTTKGHRFSEQNIVINNPDEYIAKLKKAYVIVNQDERRQLIISKAKEQADKLEANVHYTDELLDEVTFITEYPVPAICEFDSKYLDIPEEVTVTVMTVHQRYFALYKNGKLINKFITMTNYIGNDFENIKAGNVRVIKARLDDAVFFFNEDTKKPLINYVEELKGVTFQKGMGSVYDKTQRIIELSKLIANDLQINSSDIERTALLCKADLTTQLVFEFTELQGFIGADYARISKENDKVSQGIKEHYFPLNAESETAKGVEGQIVGIADKLDTICAVFADGKKPTGSSDPLGVRRAALGIMRTVLDANLKIDLNKYITKSIELLPIKKECSQEVKEFFIQRLIIMLSDSYKKNILEACANNALRDLINYIERVKVISEMNCDKMLEAANRVYRILREPGNAEVNKNLFNDNSEHKLFDAINALNTNISYKEYLNQLIAINNFVEEFFNNVLVMDKDEKIKNNRLALLSLLKTKYDLLADFSKL